MHRRWPWILLLAPVLAPVLTLSLLPGLALTSAGAQATLWGGDAGAAPGDGEPRLWLFLLAILILILLALVLVLRTRQLSRERLRHVQDDLEFTRLAVETAADPVYWARDDGTIIYVNTAACRALDKDRDSLIGLKVSDIDEDLATGVLTFATIRRTLRKKGSLRLVTHHRRRNGTIFPVDLTLTHMTHQGRDFLCAVARDITEQEETRAQLAQAQKLEAVGQLTGGIAHDFNNLLGIVLGNAELLAEKAPEHEASIRPIITAAQRGAELTQRLLSFARRQPLVAEPVALRPMLDSLGTMLTRLFGATITISVTAEPGLPPALVDAPSLEATLVNLAINARDAMPDGGRLSLDLRRFMHDGKPEDSLSPVPGTYLELTIRDTGIGMDPQTLAQAVDPFFTTKETGKGSGLGLSMAYGFARQSGGWLKLESEPGVGTVVRLYLPAATGRQAIRTIPAQARETAIEAPGSPEGALSGRGRTILLVEDEPDIRAMIQRMLDTLGFRMLVADTVDAALALLRERGGSEAAGSTAPGTQPVAAVLSDVVLPKGRSGLDLARNLETTHPGLPLVLMSGYPGRNEDDEAFASSAGRLFLRKPFTRDALLRALAQAMESGKLEVSGRLEESGKRERSGTPEA